MKKLCQLLACGLLLSVFFFVPHKADAAIKQLFLQTNTATSGTPIILDSASRAWLDATESVLPPPNGTRSHAWTPRPQDIGSYSPSNFPSPASSYYNISSCMGNSCHVTEADTFAAITWGSLWFGPSAGTTYILFWDSTLTPIAYIGPITVTTAGGLAVSAPAADLSTHIDSISPPDNSVTSLGSVPLTVNAYIDCATNAGLNECLSSPYHKLQIVAYPLTQGVSTSTLISTSTTQSVSGTFSFTVNKNISSNGTWRIETKLFDQFGNLLDSMNGSFVVGVTTNLDNLLASSSSSSIQFFNTASTTAQACSASYGTDLTACFYYLFVPDGTQIAARLDALTTDIGNVVPIGYGFRFIHIIYGTDVLPLPELSFTIPTSTVGTFALLPNKGMKLNLTPWNYLMGTTSYLATATSSITGETLLSQIMPWWTLLVQILFGLSVALTVLRFSGSKKEEVTE